MAKTDIERPRGFADEKILLIVVLILRTSGIGMLFVMHFIRQFQMSDNFNDLRKIYRSKG